MTEYPLFAATPETVRAFYAGNGRVRQATRQERGFIDTFTVRGAMMREATRPLAESLRQSGTDPAVRGILLRIDSGGGEVPGTADLAATIADVRRQKPVAVFIEDTGASAAFWVSSQATRLFANETAMVGSIGTFATLVDLSEQAEALGIKVHVIKAGEFKGLGVPGTEVTDSQLAEVQRIVNSINEHFVLGVANGRGMSVDAVRSLADGKVHVGQEAVRVGLVDEIADLERVISWLQGAAAAAMPRTGDVVEEIERGLNLSGQPAWVRDTRLARLKNRCPELHERYVSASQPAPVVVSRPAPAPTPSRPAVPARVLWGRLLAEKRRRGRNLEQAVQQLKIERPELHRRLMAECRPAAMR